LHTHAALVHRRASPPVGTCWRLCCLPFFLQHPRPALPLFCARPLHHARLNPNHIQPGSLSRAGVRVTAVVASERGAEQERASADRSPPTRRRCLPVCGEKNGSGSSITLPTLWRQKPSANTRLARFRPRSRPARLAARTQPSARGSARLPPPPASGSGPDACIQAPRRPVSVHGVWEQQARGVSRPQLEGRASRRGSVDPLMRRRLAGRRRKVRVTQRARGGCAAAAAEAR
jgi:hypothetical protein